MSQLTLSRAIVRLIPFILQCLCVILPAASWSSQSIVRESPHFAEARCGSWIRSEISDGDMVLVKGKKGPSIVLSDSEESWVKVAAQFLAKDIEEISGTPVKITTKRPTSGPVIIMQTAAGGKDWESYSITVKDGSISIIGGNSRGTAFGAYELSERLGVDPLYIWTAKSPAKHNPLIVRSGTYYQGTPAVRFRGLFHDDEDILPRPKLPERGPYFRSSVTLDWYKRFFETALRLRMNMVAPYTLAKRRYEVQKLASDWGLYYTSHHYDTLLSDPYHFKNDGLAEAAGVKPEWDWVNNRQGLLQYWRWAMDQNKGVNCIWPIGMRGTNDHGYRFPEGWTLEQKLEFFNDAFAAQASIAREKAGKNPLMHFTMYTEMLPYYETGKLKVPEGTIIVWPDDNDGRMRGLPKKKDSYKHGVYYHLAFYGGYGSNPSRNLTKQTHQIVSLDLIEKEFKAIFDSDATEFCMTNVSEIREFVLGTKFISELCWFGNAAYKEPGVSQRFLSTWCKEQFGEGAATLASEAYRSYFAMMPSSELIALGAEKCLGAIPSLDLKMKGEQFAPAMPETRNELQARHKKQLDLLKEIAAAEAEMSKDEQKLFWFENLGLAAAMDRLPTEAALYLLDAMEAQSNSDALLLCGKALAKLNQLDLLLRKAERWPFESWYDPSWVPQRKRHLHQARADLVGLIAEHS